jgi:preprotein translocase subunit SecD
MRRTRSLSLIIIVVLAVGWLTYTLTLGGRSPQLGLDLQGGTSVVLAPRQKATDAQLDQSISIIRRRVDGLGVAEPEIDRQGNFIVVSLPGVKDRDRAIQVVGQTAKLQFRPYCGSLPTGQPDPTYDEALDPNGTYGSCVAPNGASSTTTGPSAEPPSTGDPTQTTDLLNPPDVSTDLGTPEAPSPTVQNSPTIPPTSQSGLGVPATHGHLSAAQQPASTDTTAPATADTTGGSVPAPPTTAAGAPGAPSTTAPVNPLPCGKAGDSASTAPDDQGIVATDDQNKDGKVDACAVLGPVGLGGTAVSSASAAIPQGAWVVELTLKDSGLQGFNDLSGRCYNHDATCPGGSTAIVLDGNVESNPAPQTPTFTSTQVEISGSFNNKTASDLALVLNYGALPIELQQQRVETVSATLGRDSLHAGLVAGAVGLALVALYMILYYRALGIVVVLGLAVWAALNYCIIVWLSSNAGLALSLSGVTGIVVSVGVTTDSYIVYFERMKDEVKTGKTVRAAVDYGFKRAWHTIVAADLASFIGAVLLYWLTVGAVRGFAFFLGLSTLLDLVTAYFFKRPMVALLARNRWIMNARWIGIRAGLGLERVPTEQPQVAPAGAGR